MYWWIHCNFTIEIDAIRNTTMHVDDFVTLQCVVNTLVWQTKSTLIGRDWYHSIRFTAKSRAGPAFWATLCKTDNDVNCQQGPPPTPEAAAAAQHTSLRSSTAREFQCTGWRRRHFVYTTVTRPPRWRRYCIPFCGNATSGTEGELR